MAVDVDQMKADLDTCMKTKVFTEEKSQESPRCSNSAYSASAPIGRLLFCAVEVAGVQRVMDVFLGSGCSGATALAAMQTGGVLVGFEDLDVHHARAARENLHKGIRPHRVVLSGNVSTWLSVRALKALASRLHQTKSAAWVLSAKLRPNSPGCQDCARFWTVDCPEKCTYQYGVIEAVCEGLKGVDLVFWDSDGSAADGWLPEWLSIERTCAPRFVLLLNLSLPNHGAWIRERLRAFGYREIWWDAKILNPGRGIAGNRDFPLSKSLFYRNIP